MPSAKERMKKYRERLRNDTEKYTEHTEKEKERSRKRREEFRKKINSNPQLREKTRELTKNRVRAFRMRLKTKNKLDNVGDSPIGSYNCFQTFGKAVRKIKQNLPYSPLKRLAVVKKIASDVLGCDVDISNKRVNSKTINENTEGAVKEFYYRDDISRQDPGRKDYKSVKDPVSGKKVKKQKRTMIMTIREAYELFKDQHPNIKIGKSMFYQLRPAEVLPVVFTEHVVCVCAQHSNFINAVESVRKCVPEFPKSHTELIEATVCSSQSELCMTGSCANCPKDYWEMFEGNSNLNETISWKEWVSLGNRPKIVTKSMSCEAAITELKGKIDKFKLHCFVKKVQSEHFQDSIRNLKEDEAIIQIDFAENYSLVSQDEIQSAHWSHDQVTVFTCCIWLPKQDVKPVVIVSNDTSHTKYAVWTFLKSIFDYIRQITNDVSCVKIFSDNCAAQFKNRFILALLPDIKEYAKLNSLKWIFFAASHGKGAVDGLGGTVKRVAWTGVKSRRVVLNTAEDFFLFVKKEVKGLYLIYVCKTDIEADKPYLNSIWEHILTIPKIQTLHQFETINETEIAVSRTSKSESSSIVKVKDLNGDNTEFPNSDDDNQVWEDEDLQPLATLRPDPVPEKYIQPTATLQTPSCSKKKDEHYITSPLYSYCEGIETDLLPIIGCPEIDKVKTKLRFSDVYTDSEEETESKTLTAKNIRPGVFVLIRIVAEGKKKTEYRYVAVCQSSVCEDEGEVRVMFLKMVGVDAKVFNADENDISDINFNNIITILPDPILKNKGDRTYFNFTTSIDVFEK